MHILGNSNFGTVLITPNLKSIYHRTKILHCHSVMFEWLALRILNIYTMGVLLYTKFGVVYCTKYLKN